MNTDLSSTPPTDQKPPTAGELLKQGRLRQRLNLTDCAKRTHISQRYLEALEENRWKDLPSESHRLGFINLYSRFLGVPHAEVLAAYTKSQNAAPAEESPKDRTQKSKLNDPARSILPRGGPQMAVLVILLMALAWVVYHQVARWLPQETVMPIVHERPQQTRLIPPTQTVVEQRIRLQATSDTWLRVVTENQMLYEGILPAGSVKEWRHPKGFTVKIGNVQALNLFWNDQPVDIQSGARAGIKEVKIPLEK